MLVDFRNVCKNWMLTVPMLEDTVISATNAPFSCGFYCPVGRYDRSVITGGVISNTL
jgi:hypothetical protein